MKKESQMQRGLKNRHLQMIALGGAIGTGLFYGSASTISLGGPSIIAAYLICGIVIFLIMRMLGEMAVEEPVSGSFSYYANKYWGSFPGFMLGWNYWLSYVIISMAELTAVGIYVHYWLPDLPQWITALVCLIAITCLNLVNVRAYGETEFWMSFIKVAAIIGMIFLGAWLIAQDSRPFPQDFSNLWAYGGILPNGIWGVLSGYGNGHLFFWRRRINRYHRRRSRKSRTLPAQGNQSDYLAHSHLLHRYDGRHHEPLAVESDWHAEQPFRPDFHQCGLSVCGESPQFRCPGGGHFRL